jgi:hypothetical protein
MRTIRATDSPLPSHGDQVLVNHLARNQLEIAQTAREFTLPSGPATENEEDEEVAGGNVGLVSSALRILVSCYLLKVLHSTKYSEELTDGSDAVQQQGFTIVSITRQTRRSDPATPMVALLLGPLVRSAKNAPSPVPIGTLIISD